MKTIRNAAFTLIELLTVIAIIGILAAILIPVVGAVRESARNAECISNLRQIGMAIVAASDDFNGRFPSLPADPPVQWNNIERLMNVLEPYLADGYETGEQAGEGVGTALYGRGVWRCRSSGIPRFIQWTYYPNGWMWFSSSQATPPPGYVAVGRSLDSIPDLPRFPMLADRGFEPANTFGNWSIGNGFTPRKGWHSGDRLNAAFGDGSVRSYPYQGPGDTTSEFGRIMTEMAEWMVQ